MPEAEVDGKGSGAYDASNEQAVHLLPVDQVEADFEVLGQLEVGQLPVYTPDIELFIFSRCSRRSSMAGRASQRAPCVAYTTLLSSRMLRLRKGFKISAVSAKMSQLLLVR